MIFEDYDQLAAFIQSHPTKKRTTCGLETVHKVSGFADHNMRHTCLRCGKVEYIGFVD